MAFPNLLTRLHFVFAMMHHKQPFNSCQSSISTQKRLNLGRLLHLEVARDGLYAVSERVDDELLQVLGVI